MKKDTLSKSVIAFGLLSAITFVPVCQTAQAQGKLVAPVIFQAARPTSESIQGAVDAYRAALGEPNNTNNPGPLSSGRREID